MKKRFCLAVSLLFLLFCSLSCEKELFKGEPEEGTEYFNYSLECIVNGEKLEYEEYNRYYRYYYETGWLYCPVFTFSGELYDRVTHKFTGVDYSEMAFLMTPSCILSSPHLYNGIPFGNPFCFYISGDGKGPFIEGVDYSGHDNIVFFFPEIPVVIYPRVLYNNKTKPNDFKGLEVKLLSSSFRFGYSNRDDICVDEVLDFYFDFEEVITGVPEGYTSTPTVGDTIRVTNGHLAYSLFFDSSDRIHQYIAPK